MKYNLFVVEDDSSIRELYEMAFEDSPKDPDTYVFYGFDKVDDMFSALKTTTPDLIILDIMLPGIDGITALKMLKNDPYYARIPVILASAKGDEDTKVKGLNDGADDYLAKPFGLLELKARVKANLRKVNLFEKQYDERIYSYDQIVMNDAEHIVKINDKVLPCTLKEYNLLKLLISKREQVVPRDTILKEVWDYEFPGATRTLDMHIKSIRSKMDALTNVRYIKTIRGVGYKLSKD